MNPKTGSYFLLIITLLSACAGPLDTPPPGPTAGTPSAPTASPSAPPADYPPPLLQPTLSPPSPGKNRPTAAPLTTDHAVARALGDLAARLDVDRSAIEVVRVSADDFPIQNLGCPLPGGKEPDPVLPALVVGQEIVLAAGGRHYVYHAHGGLVVYCGTLP